MSIITKGYGASRDPDCEKKLQEKDKEIDQQRKRIDELEEELKKIKRAHTND